MGLFDRFKEEKMPSDEELAKSMDAFNILCNTDINDIWSIFDVNSFMTAIDSWICKKCNDGESITALSGQERIIYNTRRLEAEIYNGGFSQYFYNSSGDGSNEVVASFEAIGAKKTAAICRKAICAFGQDLPSNRERREALLDKIFTDKISEILSECDNEFYEEVDDLETLNYQFIMKNKACFS